MRWSAIFALALAACSERVNDYPEDFTEEVERICTKVCDKAVTCVDPPLVAHEECIEVCNSPGALHDDDACGKAFRAAYACIGDTATCEDYLDTRNVDAEEFECKAEILAAAALTCNSQDGTN